MALSKMTLGVTLRQCDTWHNDILHNDTRHNTKYIRHSAKRHSMPHDVMLSVAFLLVCWMPLS